MKWTVAWCNQTNWKDVITSQKLVNARKRAIKLSLTKAPSFASTAAPTSSPTKLVIEEMHDLIAEGLDYQCEAWKTHACPKLPRGPSCVECLLLSMKTPLQRLCYRHSARELCNPDCHRYDLQAVCGKEAKGLCVWIPISPLCVSKCFVLCPYCIPFCVCLYLLYFFFALIYFL
jgi:hypothetical protein